MDPFSEGQRRHSRGLRPIFAAVSMVTLELETKLRQRLAAVEVDPEAWSRSLTAPIMRQVERPMLGPLPPWFLQGAPTDAPCGPGEADASSSTEDAPSQRGAAREARPSTSPEGMEPDVAPEAENEAQPATATPGRGSGAPRSAALGSEGAGARAAPCGRPGAPSREAPAPLSEAPEAPLAEGRTRPEHMASHRGHPRRGAFSAAAAQATRLQLRKQGRWHEQLKQAKGALALREAEARAPAQ